jgi:cyclopropane-fatty-acyl-phospholipid synthase
MPSDDLFHYFQSDLKLVHQWRVNGQHYARTLNQWQQRMEQNKDAVMKFFTLTSATRHMQNWRDKRGTHRRSLV